MLEIGSFLYIFSIVTQNLFKSSQTGKFTHFCSPEKAIHSHIVDKKFSYAQGGGGYHSRHRDNLTFVSHYIFCICLSSFFPSYRF